MPSKNEHGLTPQQEKFARELVGGMSQAEAYRASYNVRKATAKTVHEMASRMMAKPEIVARVAMLQKAAAEVACLDRARVLREIERLALADIGDVFDDDGRLLMPKRIPVAARAAVKKIKVDEFGRIEYEFHSKTTALEMAAKHLGLYEADNRQKPGDLVGIVRLVPLKGKEPTDGGGG